MVPGVLSWLLPGNCADYSDSGQTIYFGRVEATAHGWTHESTISCTASGRIYCFGTDLSEPVSVVAASGRTAFLTIQSFVPDTGGLATADALCSSEAIAPGLSGIYRALLATPTANAISRVSLGGSNWVRTDGVPLADSPLAFSNGVLTAPLNVSATMTYSVANAYTGATGVTALNGGAAQGCTHCTNPIGPVYCLEQ